MKLSVYMKTNKKKIAGPVMNYMDIYERELLISNNMHIFGMQKKPQLYLEEIKEPRTSLDYPTKNLHCQVGLWLHL